MVNRFYETRCGFDTLCESHKQLEGEKNTEMHRNDDAYKSCHDINFDAL